MQDSRCVWRHNSSLRPCARVLEKMDPVRASGNDELSVRNEGPSVRIDGLSVENDGLCAVLFWTVFLKLRSVSWSNYEYEC